MFITILRNQYKNSFALMDTERNCFGIHVSNNHDLIKVYQWVNSIFRCMKNQKKHSQYVMSIYGSGYHG